MKLTIEEEDSPVRISLEQSTYDVMVVASRGDSKVTLVRFPFEGEKMEIGTCCRMESDGEGLRSLGFKTTTRGQILDYNQVGGEEDETGD